MRTIKFRVWDSNFKTMVLANDIKFVDGEMIGAKGVNWDSEVIVMQFTGLLDKNKKEIYEGDIVSNEGHINMSVIWDDREGKWATNSYRNLGVYIQEYKVEVTGNIYENTELPK
mgnify:FL=1